MLKSSCLIWQLDKRCSCIKDEAMNTLQDFLKAMDELPARSGPAPRMTPANPQEQLEQYPQDWRVIEQLAAYAFSLADVKERPTQIAPPGSRALTLDPEHASHDDEAFMVDLEFAHIHNPPVGSLHLTLPPALRAAAISKGWVLRHPLAVRGAVSPDVVFAFAPRDASELPAAKLLVKAAHAYATGQLGQRSTLLAA
jgi:hypothetical protein